MKILLYSLLLALVLLVPTQGTDVGKLIPVEVIAVSENKGTITLRTDTGNLGEGKSLKEAFSSLQETASGIIYMDTAEYLLLEPGTEKIVDELRACLKDSLRVCRAPEGIELEGSAKYLSVHEPDTRLKDVQRDTQLDTLSKNEEGYSLSEK